MVCAKEGMLLYAVTDRAWVGKLTFLEQIEASLKGGITFLQLREKELEPEALLQEAKEIKKLAAAYKVPFVVNDYVELALLADADGVHVGQEDMEAGEVRKRLGCDKIMGVTCHNVEEAVRAEQMGADYLGVGAAFATSTKERAKVIAREELRRICESVAIPVVAIGGIKEENMLSLKGSGIDGVAMVSGIYGQPEIEKTCQRLVKLAKEMVK